MFVEDFFVRFVTCTMKKKVGGRGVHGGTQSVHRLALSRFGVIPLAAGQLAPMSP